MALQPDNLGQRSELGEYFGRVGLPRPGRGDFVDDRIRVCVWGGVSYAVKCASSAVFAGMHDGGRLSRLRNGHPGGGGYPVGSGFLIPVLSSTYTMSIQ